MKADLILKDAHVWTVDPKHPQAQAVAIQGNRILAVGSNAEIEALAGSQTKIISLDGRLVLPGFNDSHTHLVSSVIRNMGAFNLFDATTLVEAQTRLKQFSQEHPQSEWLIGNRWKPNLFEHGVWPTRAGLDVVEPSRPVAVFDIDGHSCWVNSTALQHLGFTLDTPDPLGGKIVRGEDGEPNGILLENASDGIPRGIDLTEGEFSDYLCQEADHLNQLGLTSLSNNGAKPEHIDAYARLAEAGQLTLRINEWPFIWQGLEHALALRERFGDGDRIRVVGLKALADGVLSAHTAWMLEGYADAPDKIGFPTFDFEAFEQQALEADRHGFQIIVHAIGDRAVRSVLDVYERVGAVNGPRDRRSRLEHVEVAHPDDQKRFADLGVIASMTPLHCTADIDAYIRSRLGEPRGASAYAWRSFLDLGVHLCFGTDWPAVSLPAPDPLQQIFAAVTRSTPESFGDEVWHSEQCITVPEAIRAYTLEPAYAEYMEARKGSITPGKLADMIVLTENILTSPPEQILKSRVALTVFDGDVVYNSL